MCTHPSWYLAEIRHDLLETPRDDMTIQTMMFSPAAFRCDAEMSQLAMLDCRGVTRYNRFSP